MDITKEKQPTKICGIAASEHLDSSGERLSMQGLDITTLLEGRGTINTEHKSDTPSNIVGKIIFAKKIFSKEDCDNENQQYFWDKCEVPFLYIIGELFDADGHKEASDLAAMLRYDERKRQEGDKNPPTVNFSVEGAKVETDEATKIVTKSIAKKVSYTVGPCNKSSIAEIYHPEKIEKKNKAFSNMFKAEIHPQFGPQIGSTKSGKPVYQNAKADNYTGFTAQDHIDAGSLHNDQINAGGDYHHHFKLQSQHARRAGLAERREKAIQATKPQMPKMPAAPLRSMGKTLTASSGNAAPSTLTGGAALQRESLKKKISKVSLKKAQAEECFEKYKYKELLIKTIKDNYPSLTDHQALSVAKMYALKDNEKKEAILEQMLKNSNYLK